METPASIQIMPYATPTGHENHFERQAHEEVRAGRRLLQQDERAKEVIAQHLAWQVLERVPARVCVDVGVETGAMHQEHRCPVRERHDEDDAIGHRAPPALRALQHGAAQRYRTRVPAVKAGRSAVAGQVCYDSARWGRRPRSKPPRTLIVT
jgi:hypothetical protein